MGGCIAVPPPQTPSQGPQTTLHLNRYLYIINRQPTTGRPHPPTLLHATLRLVNRSNFPIDLDFDSGQVHDLVLRDEMGNVVWGWSVGQVFTDIVWQKTIPVGGEEQIQATLPLRLQGLDLPAGDYSLEFTTASRQRFTGIAAFQVRHVY